MEGNSCLKCMKPAKNSGEQSQQTFAPIHPNIHSTKSVPILYSPVTDLALNLSGLTAGSENLDGHDHAKRKLSLQDSDSASPSFPRSRVRNPLSSIENDSSFSDSPGKNKDSKFIHKLQSRFSNLFHKSESSEGSPDHVEKKSSAFRRFQQMSPVSLCDFDPSPPAVDVRSCDAADKLSPDLPSPDSQPALLVNTPTALPLRPFSLDLTPTPVKSPLKKVSPAEEDENSQDSGVCLDAPNSGEIKDTEFKFPLGLPPRPRSLRLQSAACDSTYSPQVQHQHTSSPLRPFSAPPTTLHFSSPAGADSSPLKSSPLTSFSEDGDDGFVDLLADAAEEKENVPAGLHSLFSAPVLAATENETTPSSKLAAPAVRRLISQEHRPSEAARRGLFRSPSEPSKLGRAQTFSIQSRPFNVNKRCEREDDDSQRPLVKRRKSVNFKDAVEQPKPSPRTLQRCQSEIAIKSALSRADSHDVPLIGDCSREYTLPLCQSKHQDLRGISHDTMSSLLRGEYNHLVEKFMIIDCRYPYEYQGGHIKGAHNLYTKEEIFNTFIKTQEWKQPANADKRTILIFHCEFSSERGPKMSRFVRNHDRDANKESYPSLYYPEMYLLEGGYKVFWENHADQCTKDDTVQRLQPTEHGNYKPMLQEGHGDDLKFFRAKSKSWAGDQKTGGRGMSRHKSRTGLGKRFF